MATAEQKLRKIVVLRQERKTTSSVLQRER
jgi:hypothetical protein